MRSAPPDRVGWLDALEARAPDFAAAYRALAEGRFLTVRREVRQRGGAGSTARLVEQHRAIAEHLAALLRDAPPELLGRPGGEADWNVAQALGHAIAARSGLVLAAQLAVAGRWPADAPTVVPGVPGAAAAPREELLRRLETSQRLIERAARTVAGHEEEPCPLDHPQVGRLRCGEWLVFAGVHDLMHVAQLERLVQGEAAAG